MNRRAVVLTGLVAWPAARVAMPGSAAPTRDSRRKHRPARPRPVLKTVTRTFASTELMTVPGSGTSSGPASPYPSTILVSGLKNGRSQKVTVTLKGLSHTFPTDLDVLVVAPNGRAVVVMSDLGGGGTATGATLVFDDQAPGPPPLTLVTGVYLPTNVGSQVDAFPLPAPIDAIGASLADLIGGNPNGHWHLYVVDDTSPDGGTIGGWSLTIRALITVKPKPRRKPRRKPKRRRGQRCRRFALWPAPVGRKCPAR